MKTRRPLVLIAFISQVSLAATLPWQDVPAIYNTSGGDVTVVLDADKDIDLDSLLLDENAIEIRDGGTFVFDGGGFSLEFTNSASIQRDGTLRKAIFSDADLTFSNFYDLTLSGGLLSLTDSPHDVPPLIYNPSDVDLSSTMVYSTKDVVFSHITGELTLYNNYQNINKEAYDRNLTVRATTLYAGGDLSFSGIEGNLNIGSNHLNLYVNLPDTVVALGSLGLYQQGGVIFAGGDINFSELDSGLLFNNQSTYSNLGHNLKQNNISVEMVSLGGGMYAGGMLSVSDISGVFDINQNTDYVLLSISSFDGFSMGEEIDVRGNLTIKGGVVYTGEGILLSGNADISVQTNVIQANTIVDINSNQELSPNLPLNLDISTLIQGAAFYSQGNIVLSGIQGNIAFNGNNIFGSYGMTLGEGTHALPNEINIKGSYNVLGSAISSEEAVVIDDISGEVSFSNNNIYYNTYNSPAYTIFNYRMNLNHVHNIDYSSIIGGVGMYSKGGVSFRGITGNILISTNVIQTYSLLNIVSGSTFNIDKNSGAFGAGIYSAGEIEFGNIQGNVTFDTNTIGLSEYITGADNDDVHIKNLAWVGGVALFGEKSISFNEIQGDIQFSNNNGSISFITDKQPDRNSEGMGVRENGAVYAGEDVVFSRIEGNLEFSGNKINLETNVDYNAKGGGAYAGGIFAIDNITGDVSVSGNELSINYNYWGQYPNSYNVTGMESGGGLASGGGMLFSGIEGKVTFENNLITGHHYPQLAGISGSSFGAGIYSEGSIAWQNTEGDILFSLNKIEQVYYLENKGGALINTGGGAMAAMDGMVVADTLTGNMTFRDNSVVVEMLPSAPLERSYSYSSGGALYLGGDSVIQKVKGTILFENNYAVGRSSEETAYVEVQGGAVALAQGGTLTLRADEGDILFQNNASGWLPDTLAPVVSYGGAIYVAGANSSGGRDLLRLDAGSGRVIAFTGNLHKTTINRTGDYYSIEGGTGEYNSIYMNKNSTLHLSGEGSIFFDDPIASGEAGGVGVVKTGKGTAYFVTQGNEINGKGLGDNAVRVEGGYLHVSSAGEFHLTGNDALVNVLKGGTLSGSGIFSSEGGFVISGDLSPDSIDYSLRVTGQTPVISSMGGNLGTLHLQGNAIGSGGRLISEVDMVSGEGDRVVIDGNLSGSLIWKGTHIGNSDEADLNRKVVVLEVLGDVEPKVSITGDMKVGIYKVGLEHGANPNGSGMAWWTSYKEELIPDVDAVLNTAGALAGPWFRQLDNLHRRMGELRLGNMDSAQGNAWVRTYGLQSDADMKIKGIHDMREYHYGVDMGTDNLLYNREGKRLYAGIFAGYQRMDRQFHDEFRSKGNTDSVLGGAYFTWLEDSGWYVDVVMKGQSFENSGEVYGSEPGRFSYANWGLGTSLEAGRKIDLGGHWFVEPFVQASWLYLSGKNYLSATGMEVQSKSSNSWQLSGMSRIGRTDYMGRGHAVQTYLKAGVVQQMSGGGAVHIDGHSWRPNTDGTQGIGGVGIIWQFDQHQIHLDYEAGIGDKVDMPWNVNLGYRYQF